MIEWLYKKIFHNRMRDYILIGVFLGYIISVKVCEIEKYLPNDFNFIFKVLNFNFKFKVAFMLEKSWAKRKCPNNVSISIRTQTNLCIEIVQLIQ
jgi:hypothetical protein